MKRLPLLFPVLVLSVFFIISCGSSSSSGDDGGIYSYKNLPGAIGVIPPDSINKQSAPSSSALNKYSGALDVKTKDLLLSASSSAYTPLLEEIEFVRNFMKDMEIGMMMIDVIWDDITAYTGGVSGTIPADTLTFTYTAAMENRIKELLPGIQINLQGVQVTVPEIDLTVNPDSSEYKYEVKFVQTISISEPNDTEISKTVKWSLDKTKVYTEQLQETNSSFSGTQKTSIVSKYSAISKIMELKIVDHTNDPTLYPENTIDTFNIFMKDTGNAANEIYYDSTYMHADDVTAVVIDKNVVRADDDGGAILNDFWDSSGLTSIKETFDGSGNIILRDTSTDGITYTPDTITDDFSTYELNTSQLSLTGFAPATDDFYLFFVAADGTPLYSSDPGEFFTGIIGFIIWEKTATTSEIADSFYWGTSSQITNAKVYDVDYAETGYTPGL